MLNDDMINLFNSTEIAAVFLDENMAIKRFTPKVQQIIHLIQADVGRSITHFATNINYETMINDAEQVLKTLIPKTREVKSRDNIWYQIRILPYRTTANVIDGVIITFSDISFLKNAEIELKFLNNTLSKALSYSNEIFDAVREPMLVLNDELHITTANEAFYKMFDHTNKTIIGKKIDEITIKQCNVQDLKNVLVEVIKKNKMFANFELLDALSDNKKIQFNARKIINDDGNNLILLSMERD
jgi:two-component system CheB/CheR fusion protein